MSNRMKANRDLLTQIVAIHGESHETYGSPRVWETLKKQGVDSGKNRVAHLMRKAGIKGRVVKVTRRVPGVQRFYERHENLRLGRPLPTRIDKQWVGDVTFLRAKESPASSQQSWISTPEGYSAGHCEVIERPPLQGRPSRMRSTSGSLHLAVSFIRIEGLNTAALLIPTS